MNEPETEFKYISEFEIVGDKREDALEGNKPRELEQTEYPFIQARRVKAYTGHELNPTTGFACRDQDKPVELAEGWGEPKQRHERNLVGLAFSGGGIRSATFGLGVLQALAELEVLKAFDYLSTVSGGGFIGSWLASWIKREGDVANVEKQLKPERVEQAEAVRGFAKDESAITPGFVGKGEPEPIFHLREFSNYLSPRLSTFSADSWTLLAIYLRNFLANQLVLLPLVVAVLLLTRIYVGFLALPRWALALASFIPLLLALRWIEKGFSFLKLITACGVASVVVSYWWEFAFPQRFDPHVIAAFGPPAVLSAIGLVACVWVIVLSRDANEQEREWLSRFGAWLLLISVCWIAIFGVSLYGALWFWRADGWIQSTLTMGWIASAVAGVKAASSSKTNGQSDFKILDAVAIAGPVIFLVGLGCGLSVAMDEAFGSLKSTLSAGQSASEMDKPLPAESVAAPKKTNPKDPQFASTEVTYKSTLSGDEKTPKNETVWTRRVLETPDEAATIASDYWKRIEKTHLRLLLVFFSLSALLAAFFGWRVDINEFSLNAMYANRLARCYLGASRRKKREDVCGTPSHSSGPIRDPDKVTGLDVNDDFALDQLRIGPVADSPEACPEEKKPHGYWGPFPLINTALNLVAGDQLAWQERRAESFVLSPLYCGANSVGYRDARVYSAGKLTHGNLRKLKPLTLGRSVAISGAAASPNMGYHSAPAPAALMTIFNVRLGWWLPNPKSNDVFTAAGPGSGLQWLLCELFGYTNTKRDFINLSDGGHFENLGVYELVRRRCRFIVVADGGADPNFEFEDLAGLIRKCRSDFGIDIEIDVSKLRRKDGKRSDVHCAIGTIRYDQVEPTAPVGTLVYIKPSLTGDESADIQYYAGKHPDFPHQPTLDQFFNESQFESYRALGYHCISEVFDAAVERVRNSAAARKLLQTGMDSDEADPSVLLKTANVRHGFEVENLFYHLRKEWLTVPSEFETGFLQSVEGFEDLQRDLAADPRLAKIDPGLYPELKSLFSHSGRGDVDENRRAKNPDDSGETGHDNKAQHSPSVELHTASRMLQVMENAFLGAQMNLFYAHPLNAGWMNVFQRWGNWPPLRHYWPLLRNEYSREFVRFCERKLALKSEFTARPITIERLIKESPHRESSWSQICGEFDAEWPVDSAGGPLNLKDFHAQAWQDTTTSTKAFYCLLVGSKGEPDPKMVENGFIGGVLALRELRKEHCHELGLSANGACALCTTDSTAGYELLVWVRPAFRQQSIGTRLVEQLFDMLFTHDEEPKPIVSRLGNEKTVRLSVLYPKTGWTANGGDKMEKSMWLSFFSFYGFRKLSAKCPHSDLYEVLTLEIEPVKPTLTEQSPVGESNSGRAVS